MKLNTDRGEWFYLDEVDSTNSHLLRGDFPSGSVCMAKNQTGGRGRNGRQWKSLSQRSFLFSGLLRFSLREMDSKRVTMLPILCGSAMLSSIEKFGQTLLADGKFPVSGSHLIKWPNDIYVIVNDTAKKLAGILVETQITGDTASSVIGIGMNWNSIPEQDGDFQIPPISYIDDCGDAEADMFSFASVLVSEMNERLEQLISPVGRVPQFVGEVRQKFYLRNRKIELNQKRYRVLDLEDDGGLRVENIDSGGIEVLYEAPQSMRVIV